MKTLTKKIEVDVSKEEVWEVLFNQFGQVSRFNPLIKGSAHLSGAAGEVGATRSCDLNTGGTIKEEIISAEPMTRFEFEIIEGSMPMVKKMFAAYSLRPLADTRTEVTFIVKFMASPSFMGGIVKMMMGRMFLKMLASLKDYLEIGIEVNQGNHTNR
ncbi:SRPBCC family protein [Fulvivirgaceae bacterium BMA12]|uniref:SRPBCC family protein n=1 Tax=Agaribacillus aureus TaxID=3051825 RepID=A0ABT8L6X5_9BACT|nr:SRPBCC family protein [Fulvivirgaceae bacterium BMA12]